MKKNRWKIYGPNQRTYFEPNSKKIKSYSKTNYTHLPSPVTDPIVTNNIATSEFNYTYNCEEDIWGDDYLDDYF